MNVNVFSGFYPEFEDKKIEYVVNKLNREIKLLHEGILEHHERSKGENIVFLTSVGILLSVIALYEYLSFFKGFDFTPLKVFFLAGILAGGFYLSKIYLKNHYLHTQLKKMINQKTKDDYLKIFYSKYQEKISEVPLSIQHLFNIEGLLGSWKMMRDYQPMINVIAYNLAKEGKFTSFKLSIDNSFKTKIVDNNLAISDLSKNFEKNQNRIAFAKTNFAVFYDSNSNQSYLLTRLPKESSLTKEDFDTLKVHVESELSNVLSDFYRFSQYRGDPSSFSDNGFDIKLQNFLLKGALFQKLHMDNPKPKKNLPLNKI